MKRFSPPLALCLLPALILSSCSDGDDPVAVQMPSVRITAGTATENSLTFTVDPLHAEVCAWLVVPADAAGDPVASDVLQRGTAADAAAKDAYTASELDPETRYAVYAAVASSAGTALASIEMTTMKKDVPVPAPSVEIRIGETSSASVTFTLSPMNADRCFYMVVAAGGRLPDAATLERDGTQAGPSSDEPYTVDGLTPRTDYAVVAVAAQGDRFGEVESAAFTTAEEQPKLPGLTADVTDKVLTYVERANYFGDVWGLGTGWFVYALRDGEPDENGNYPAGSAQLAFELHADLAASEGGVLPAGTYTVGSQIAPGVCLPGKILDGFYEGSYVADVTYYACDGEWGIVNGGTVAVEKNDEGYRIAFDLTTEDGHRVTASYSGDLQAPDGPVDPDATSTLKGDYEVRFAEGEGTEVNAYYYGYDAELLADVWSVYMEPVRKDDTADGFMMDLLVDPALGFAAGFPAGTADEPDEYGPGFWGEPGHYLVGEYDAEGTMIHSWYLGGYLRGPGDEWLVTRYAAVKNGFIYISRTGDDYTVTLEYSDESWHTVTGTWAGKIAVHDLSEAPASVARRVAPAR